MMPTLSEADAQALALRAARRWVANGRSKRAKVPLFELVDDEGSWRPPRVSQARYYRGAVFWWRLCCLRGHAAARGQLSDLKILLHHIETGEAADPVSLARGLALVDAVVRQTIPRMGKQQQLAAPVKDAAAAR
jgi:hypothetical protein